MTAPLRQSPAETWASPEQLDENGRQALSTQQLLHERGPGWRSGQRRAGRRESSPFAGAPPPSSSRRCKRLRKRRLWRRRRALSSRTCMASSCVRRWASRTRRSTRGDSAGSLFTPLLHLHRLQRIARVNAEVVSPVDKSRTLSYRLHVVPSLSDPPPPPPDAAHRAPHLAGAPCHESNPL